MFGQGMGLRALAAHFRDRQEGRQHGDQQRNLLVAALDVFVRAFHPNFSPLDWQRFIACGRYREKP